MTDLNAEGINRENNCVNAVVSLASLPVVNLFRLFFHQIKACTQSHKFGVFWGRITEFPVDLSA